MIAALFEQLRVSVRVSVAHKSMFMKLEGLIAFLGIEGIPQKEKSQLLQNTYTAFLCNDNSFVIPTKEYINSSFLYVCIIMI